MKIKFSGSTRHNKKHKKGLRYRLLSLKELYQKFLTDVQEVECSYTQFCCNVPKEIIKPKPEDWEHAYACLVLILSWILKPSKEHLEALTILPLNHWKINDSKKISKIYVTKLKKVTLLLNNLNGTKKRDRMSEHQAISPRKILVPALEKNFLKNSKKILNHWLTMHPDLSHNIKGLLRLNIRSRSIKKE